MHWCLLFAIPMVLGCLYFADSCQQFPIPDHVYFDESSSAGKFCIMPKKLGKINRYNSACYSVLLSVQCLYQQWSMDR